MVDYVIWPWAEKAGLLEIIFKEKPVPDDAFPKIREWCKAMHSVKGVKETFVSPEEQYKIFLALTSNAEKK